MARAVPTCFALLLLACGARAAQALPADVARYIERRQTCDHWRGEASDDRLRAVEIQQAVCRHCPGADAGLARLQKKHATDAVVLARLADFDPRIEPGSSAELKAALKAVCGRVAKRRP